MARFVSLATGMPYTEQQMKMLQFFHVFLALSFFSPSFVLVGEEENGFGGFLFAYWGGLLGLLFFLRRNEHK